MNRRLTKPFTKNVRIDSPLGLLGVPPDTSTVIIVSNDYWIKRLADELLRGKNIWPQ